MPRWHWVVWAQLVWTAWLLTGPAAAGLDALATAFTALSVLAFLPLYCAAWLDDRARLPLYTTLIAVLGLVSLPVNGSWAYGLYAASLVAYCAVPGVAVSWLAVLLLSHALVAELTPDVSPVRILTWASVCLLAGLATLGLQVLRRHQAALLLSCEQVRRLAETAERERIGRDLHDLLGATLGLIAIKGELAGRLFERDPAAARREVVDIELVAREALEQVRKAMTGMCIARLAGEVAGVRLLLESRGVEVDADIDTVPLTRDSEELLAAALREVAEHAARQAQARRIEIRLLRERDTALLVISDDGRGGTLLPASELALLAQRLGAAGGSLGTVVPGKRAVSSSGRRLECRVPLGQGDASGGLLESEDDGMGSGGLMHLDAGSVGQAGMA